MVVHRFGHSLCLAGALVGSAACGGGGSASDQTRLMISAAASLREVITRASESFEEESPGVRVQLNFAGSGALRQQIEMGAPVNVFVSAATEHIDRLAESGLVDPDGRRIFARNRLVLIGAAEKVRSLADLRSDSVARVAIGDPRSVPAGNYARKWLEAEGLWPEIEEKTVLAGDVRQVLSYVERGEVDAGIVYATDAKLLGLQPILTATGPPAPEVVYEAAILDPMDESRAAARRFFDYLGSETVTHELETAGFMAP